MFQPSAAGTWNSPRSGPSPVMNPRYTPSSRTIPPK